MRERRSSKRISINRRIKIDLEGTELYVMLVDLSADGALFSLGGPGTKMLSKADLGRQVSFKVKPLNRPMRKYTGEIIRFFYRNGQPLVALRFWKRYEEIV